MLCLYECWSDKGEFSERNHSVPYTQLECNHCYHTYKIPLSAIKYELKKKFLAFFGAYILIYVYINEVISQIFFIISYFKKCKVPSYKIFEINEEK